MCRSTAQALLLLLLAAGVEGCGALGEGLAFAEPAATPSPMSALSDDAVLAWLPGVGKVSVTEGSDTGPAPGAATRTPLKLPWTAGEAWFFASGPHGANRSAVDFAPPNLNPKTRKPFRDSCSRLRGNAFWVRAAADGTVDDVLPGRCPLVRLKHDDGTTTNYFHLRSSSVTQLGLKKDDPVRAGQKLGHPSCEVGPPSCGSTEKPTGLHVHFHRRAASGARLPADGMVISGWTVKAKGADRAGTITLKGDSRSCARVARGWLVCSTSAIVSDNSFEDP